MSLIPLDTKRQRSAVWLIAFSAICFSFQGIAVKLLYSEAIALESLLMWRLALYLPLALPIAFFYKKIQHPNLRHTLIILLIGAFGFYAMPYLAMASLRHIEAGIERVILFSNVLFILLFTAGLERRVPPRVQLTGALVSYAGLYLLIGGAEHLDILQNNLLPALMVLTAAIFSAIYAMLTQHYTRKISAITYVMLAQMGGFLASLVVYIASDKQAWPTISAPGWSYIIFLALISFPPAILFAQGVKYIGGARAALISMIGPVFTFAFAYVIFGETVSLSQLFGAAIVLGALAMVELQVLRQTKRQSREDTQHQSAA